MFFFINHLYFHTVSEKWNKVKNSMYFIDFKQQYQH